MFGLSQIFIGLGYNQGATKLESKIKTADDLTLMKECNSDTIKNHGIYRHHAYWEGAMFTQLTCYV